MPPCLAIQHVHLRWTKDDRGPEAGAVRNALRRAEAFRPPSASAAGWLQHIRYDAAEGYRRVETWQALSAIAAERLPVRTRIESDHLWIRLAVTGGQPRRPQLDGWIVRLPLGQRAVIRTNQKYDGDHQRLYEEHHVSVGFAATATLDLPLFREVDERVLLY